MNNLNTNRVTLFYDGSCPLCQAEIKHLIKYDQTYKLELVDISQPDFSQRYPELSFRTLNRRLHALDDRGQWLLGLDATYAIWSAVGKRHWVLPLKWRWFRLFADPVYELFARHRESITSLLFRRTGRTCPNRSNKGSL